MLVLILCECSCSTRYVICYLLSKVSVLRSKREKMNKCLSTGIKESYLKTNQ